MPQAKPGYSRLLAKWMPDPAQPPSRPGAASPRTVWSGLKDGASAALHYELLRNPFMCNLAKNFWIGASQLSGTSLNTPTEKAMMGRYFGGGGGSYRLNPGEWKAAVDLYNRYGNNLLSGKSFRTPDGGFRQNINFAGTLGDDRLDGLLGTATGYFDRDRKLTGLRDRFDFDGAPRGRSDNMFAQAMYKAGGKLVGLVQDDADTFCPKRSNPVTISGGSRR